jgi:Flp pilus assembly protein CpaB
MPRRRVVIASVAVATVAAVMAWVMAAPTDGTQASRPDDQQTLVLRATAPIAAGMQAESLEVLGLVEFVAADTVATPEFPVVSLDALAGMVTATDIDDGEVLGTAMFISPTSPDAGLATRLDAGHTALAVTVDATRAVGGWLRPGDRVNILVPSSCPDSLAVSDRSVPADLEVKCRRVRYLYQAVLVVAVGADFSEGSDDAATLLPQSGAATLVLSLPPRAAQWVASYDNDLWFTLVPSKYQPRPVGPLPALIDRLPGEEPSLLTPDCSDPADPAATPVGGQDRRCDRASSFGFEP